MVELHVKTGQLIRINLRLISEIKRAGSRTILRARIRPSSCVEFEVLESIETIRAMGQALS